MPVEIASPELEEELPQTPPSDGSASRTTEAAAEVAASAQETSPEAAGSEAMAAIDAFMNALQISGVKVEGTRSRAILNNAVYSVGEPVSEALGLRLEEVRAEEVVLIDSEERRYVKRR